MRAGAQRYAVVIEPVYDETGELVNYGAYVPDLPGCIAGGDTPEETEQLIREAVSMHLAALRRDGDPIPPPRTKVIQVAGALG